MRGSQAKAVPFEGTPPAVKAGDAVEIRDASGVWHHARAVSEPRYDFPKALGGRCYLTVAVLAAGWGQVNWPAEAVRPAETTSEKE
jgi:hypothetical protein